MPGQDEIPNTATTNQYPQAGSDEVGTGDYFGPVCVCASYVTQDNVDFLIKLGVRDSKTNERYGYVKDWTFTHGAYSS